ncbi:SHOCT domain-containing protein [Paenibacillus sp. y28]
MKRLRKTLLPATLALALVIPQAAMAADTTNSASTAASTERPAPASFQPKGKAFGSSALSTDYIEQLVNTYAPDSLADWTTVLEKRESLKTEIKTVTSGLHNNNPFAGTGAQAELTDEQKAERDAQKAQLAELKAQLDAGTITKDEYLAQLKALLPDHDGANSSRAAAELTDEQKAERDAQKAQLAELKAQLDAGTITKDEYLAQLKALLPDHDGANSSRAAAELTDEQKAERDAQKAQLAELKAQLDAGAITKDEYLAQLKALGLDRNVFGGSERSNETTGWEDRAQGQKDSGSRGGPKQAVGGPRGPGGHPGSREQAQGQDALAGKGGNGLQGPRGGQHPNATQASTNSTEANTSESVTTDETTETDTELPSLSVQEQLYEAIQNEDSELIETLLPLLLEEYKNGNTSLQDTIDELAALAASTDSTEEE